jgi:hypothetical protein
MSPKITAEIVTATKELVDTLLAMNVKNRNIKLTNVQYLKNEILNGNYELTSQGIGICASGILSDGQHRLMAIKEAGYPPVKLLIVRGLSDKAQLKTDIGAKRTIADMLALHMNQTVSNTMVAAINVIARLVNGKGRISPTEAAEMLVEYDLEFFHLRTVEGFSITTAPVYAAFLYALKQHQDLRILEFARQVSTGELLTSEDPAFVLRKFLNSGPGGIKGGNAVQKDRFGKTIYAIDAFLNNQKIQRVYCRELPTKIEVYLKSRKEVA